MSTTGPVATYVEAENQMVHAGNGVDYAYRITGDSGAPPLIMLQHFRGNLDNWDPALVDALARNRQVITFDNRGVGGSSGRTPSTVAHMARDALEFLDALGLDAVDVLGFSLGSFVAQDVALVRPAMVRRLVLASSAPQGADRRVERLQPPRGVQQQRGRVTVARGEGDMAPEQFHPSALELVERLDVCGGHQAERPVEGAGLEARVRGSQRALRAPAGVLCEHDGAVQERRRGGQAAARLRAPGRTLELSGDLLVGSRRRRGKMPRPAVRVEIAISHLRQCQVHRSASLDRG
jgi:pimeloyl-ACP methyl ester carboxylesterase